MNMQEQVVCMTENVEAIILSLPKTSQQTCKIVFFMEKQSVILNLYFL